MTRLPVKDGQDGKVGLTYLSRSMTACQVGITSLPGRVDRPVQKHDSMPGGDNQPAR
jgi:hypothetical protein